MYVSIIAFGLFCLLATFLRGGSLHNYLVCEAERIFQSAGYETHQEHPEKLPCGGLDFIDLLARRGGFAVCVEVELSARYVLSNVSKCRQLDLPMVVLVPSRKVQKAIMGKLKKAGITPGKHRLCILLLGQLEQEVTNYCSLFVAVSKNQKTNK